MIEEVKNTHDALRKGGVVLLATDTCWALACDATSEHAVKRLSEIKGFGGPFVVLIQKSDWLSTYVVTVPEIAWDIVDLSEKPLTVIYSKGKNVAPAVLGPNGSIALRVPKDKFLLDLIGKFQKPVIATMISEKVRAFAAIPEEIKSKVDYIVKLRQEEKVTDPPSEIMSLGEGGEVKFLRR